MAVFPAACGGRACRGGASATCVLDPAGVEPTALLFGGAGPPSPRDAPLPAPQSPQRIHKCDIETKQGTLQPPIPSGRALPPGGPVDDARWPGRTIKLAPPRPWLPRPVHRELMARMDGARPRAPGARPVRGRCAALARPPAGPWCASRCAAGAHPSRARARGAPVRTPVRSRCAPLSRARPRASGARPVRSPRAPAGGAANRAARSTALWQARRGVGRDEVWTPPCRALSSTDRLRHSREPEPVRPPSTGRGDGRRRGCGGTPASRGATTGRWLVARPALRCATPGLQAAAPSRWRAAMAHGERTGTAHPSRSAADRGSPMRP